MTQYDPLDQFGELFISAVRNRTQWAYRQIENGSIRVEKNRHDTIQALASSPEHKEKLRQIVEATIDDCLHEFLFMLENNYDTLELLFKASDGSVINVAETSDGLCGELYTEDGWIEKFGSHLD
ncbi:hypothetical protein [Roseibium alexandrii]|uniref:Uncharacterized protein n=1 Tax=Roseibium alexandrii (strain DSM 17067 / NCIMB 14079 / DFL-11) TaxID=244592 RepID=A0A5E8GZ66_ROSAD|nr:hypothetical protein [Roseibium alexandrii]EEE44884.2 hypothetical protein SADFL11_2172 [Roseibium alexandrii DFL-11]